MKKFLLGCENDHEFEGWFADADAIRQQLQAGLLDCPYCGSTNLEKRLSSPNLSTPKTKARIRKQQQDALTPAAVPISDPESVAATGPSAVLAPSVGDGAAALRIAVRALHQKIQCLFKDGFCNAPWHSRVAQWKRAGPITQRSVDRNHALLTFFLSSLFFMFLIDVCFFHSLLSFEKEKAADDILISVIQI